MRLNLHRPAEYARWFARNTKRLVVLTAGLAVLGAGIAMLALPGPGMVVIILGLAILATEFAWAERALDRTTSTAASAATKVSGSRSGRLLLASSAVSMITGGAFVVAVWGEYHVAGASVALAGVIGLATLLPQVQRWLEVKANGSARVAEREPSLADDRIT